MHAARARKPQALRADFVLYALLAAIAGGSGAFADEPPDVTADVAMVRPLIGETTALVVKIDPQRLAPPDLEEFLEQTAPAELGDYRQAKLAATYAIAAFRAATGDQPIYGTIGIPISEVEWPMFFFLRRTPQVDENLVREHLAAAPGLRLVVREEILVAGPDLDGDVAAAFDAIVPSPRDELGAVFETVAGYPIQVLLLPPDYVRRTVVELMPQLPRQLGGGSSEVLTEGLLWAALGVDPGRLQIELIIQSASEAAAQRVAKHLPVMVRSIYREVPDLQRRLPPEELLLRLIAPAVDGDRVVLRIEPTEPEGGIMGLFAAAVAAVQEEMRPAAEAVKFKRILLAMHNYHDTFSMLPPRDHVRDDQGRTGLSWRVHLLPFLAEQKLYDEFRLDEPWDSDHNKALIAKMPDVYRSPSPDVALGHTTFLAPVGEDTVFGGPKATRFSDIRDGTSNTVVLVEVKPERAVPWTAPDDYTFDPKSPGRGLQVDDGGRFLAAFADGSVRRLRAGLDPELLLRLFQKNSGKPIDWYIIDRITGPVSGSVSLDGRPLAEGKLVLHPPAGPPIEIEITDGAFAAKEVPVAVMRVVIRGTGVPESFGRQETTALVVQTAAGANVFNFELPRED
ncbi:MAG: DUF1559 domain-containing protein [Planctomycetaceae bacterium]|nr:MAG: DUF1559 domain-containing protein [Planctomycetaceae bacterium]